MKIAFLLPSTTKNRPWDKIEDTYLYNIFGKSLLDTIGEGNGMEYTAYIYIDIDDPIYSQKKELIKLKQLLEPKIKVCYFYDKSIKKGHLTSMWNRLFKLAYNEKNDYFYQCGDDIMFKNKNWLDECINVLQKQNNIGICGPINPPNKAILTQTLVSRKHMDIFGYYFPKQIQNWFCDDWINVVYHPNHVNKLTHLVAENVGGNPRYHVPNLKEYNKIKQNVHNIINNSKKILNTYIVANQP